MDRTDRLAVVMAPGVDLATCLLAGMAVAAVAPLVPSSPLGIVLDDLRRLRATHVLVDGDPPAAVLDAAQELGLPLLHLDPLASATEPVARFTVPVVADFIWLPTGRCTGCRRWGSTQPPSATGVWRRRRSTTPT